MCFFFFFSSGNGINEGADSWMKQGHDNLQFGGNDLLVSVAFKSDSSGEEGLLE